MQTLYHWAMKPLGTGQMRKLQTFLSPAYIIYFRENINFEKLGYVSIKYRYYWNVIAAHNSSTINQKRRCHIKLNQYACDNNHNYNKILKSDWFLARSVWAQAAEVSNNKLSNDMVSKHQNSRAVHLTGFLLHYIPKTLSQN